MVGRITSRPDGDWEQRWPVVHWVAVADRVSLDDDPDRGDERFITIYREDYRLWWPWERCISIARNIGG